MGARPLRQVIRLKGWLDEGQTIFTACQQRETRGGQKLGRGQALDHKRPEAVVLDLACCCQRCPAHPGVGITQQSQHRAIKVALTDLPQDICSQDPPLWVGGVGQLEQCIACLQDALQAAAAQHPDQRCGAHLCFGVVEIGDQFIQNLIVTQRSQGAQCFPGHCGDRFALQSLLHCLTQGFYISWRSRQRQPLDTR